MGGAVVGLAAALLLGGLAPAAAPAERASAAVVALLGLGAAAAPAFPGAGPMRATAAAIAAVAAGATAVLVAGAGGLASAAVLGGAALLAAGSCDLARRAGFAAGAAALAGAAVPCALAAGVFVADPFVEWDGATASSRAIAHAVYATSPVAAATSPLGGTGVDWQTRPLLYDGGGAGGLSVIGQFYPSRPASPWTWGGAAAAGGLLLSLAGRRSADRRPSC